MFEWHREKAEQKVIQSHLPEIPWLRNIFKRTTGIDLNKPEEAVEKPKMLAVELGGQPNEPAT
jgi:hypothetical protein